MARKKTAKKAATAPPKKLPRVQAFLAAYRETASVSEAAKAAGIQRGIHYRRLKADPVYAAAFAEAHEQAIESLEDEAIRRARRGVLRPVFFQGVPCGQVRVYSDSLMMFLLRGAKPEKYRERFQHDVNGNLKVTRFKGTLEELLAAYRNLTTEDGETASDE